ncbi:hypothetical protein D3C76_1862920 [compost metagenome]
MAYTAPIMIRNVVVLMPPPVEPGEAPINISNMKKNCVACRISVISMVLVPEERVETDWKKEA